MLFDINLALFILIKLFVDFIYFFYNLSHFLDMNFALRRLFSTTVLKKDTNQAL